MQSVILVFTAFRACIFTKSGSSTLEQAFFSSTMNKNLSHQLLLLKVCTKLFSLMNDTKKQRNDLKIISLQGVLYCSLW
jgi:hypothetical protein